MFGSVNTGLILTAINLPSSSGFDDAFIAPVWVVSLGLDQKPTPFKEQDMCHSPKFTAPLVDRCVVAGYAAAISCAVRGFPKVPPPLCPAC